MTRQRLASFPSAKHCSPFIAFRCASPQRNGENDRSDTIAAKAIFHDPQDGLRRTDACRAAPKSSRRGVTSICQPIRHSLSCSCDLFSMSKTAAFFRRPSPDSNALAAHTCRLLVRLLLLSVCAENVLFAFILQRQTVVRRDSEFASQRLDLVSFDAPRVSFRVAQCSSLINAARCLLSGGHKKNAIY